MDGSNAQTSGETRLNTPANADAKHVAGGGFCRWMPFQEREARVNAIMGLTGKGATLADLSAKVPELMPQGKPAAEPQRTMREEMILSAVYPVAHSVAKSVAGRFGDGTRTGEHVRQAILALLGESPAPEPAAAEPAAAEPLTLNTEHPWVKAAFVDVGPAVEVRNDDGRVQWQRPDKHLSFGEALLALKDGHRVARAGWNGKGMWLYLNLGSHAPDEQRQHIDGVSRALFTLGDTGTATRLPNINMRAASGATVTGWLASQTDMLAEDWTILEAA